MLCSHLKNNLCVFKGFEGDRNAALKSISITSRSRDMRSQLADTILLWYEIVAKATVVTELNPSINTQTIDYLLDKNLQKCPKSTFFMYYKGKI
jgi:hypothetical protein